MESSKEWIPGIARPEAGSQNRGETHKECGMKGLAAIDLENTKRSVYPRLERKALNPSMPNMRSAFTLNSRLEALHASTSVHGKV